MRKVKISEVDGRLFAAGYSTVIITEVNSEKTVQLLDSLKAGQCYNVRLSDEPPMRMKVVNVGDAVVLASVQ